MNINTNTELGNDPAPQLYNLKLDPAEKDNAASQNPTVVNSMQEKLKTIKEKSLPRQ